VTDGQEPVESGVLREAAHALERDPGLIAAGRAERDHGARDGEEVVQGDLGRQRGLRVSAGDDRGDLSGRPEVGAGDPALVGVQRLVDQLAQFREPREPGADRLIDDYGVHRQ
jgi:hypothetical protein